MKTFENKQPPSELTPLDEGELEIRLEQLKGWYPEWFNYSDSLGERPIDGMMRTMRRDWDMRKESQMIQQDQGQATGRQVQQNLRVAPEYTNEAQQGMPPGYVRPMGKVM